MKNILVPCDFSAPARQAYKFAIEIASASKGQVFVINTILLPVLYESAFGVQPYPLEAAQMKAMEENSLEAFEKLQRVHPNPSNVPVQFSPVFDFLISGITTFVREKNIDLIVMGTSGASGLEEIFIGSNTEKIVRFSDVPVMAVRESRFLSDIRDIVVPVALDYNQTAFFGKVKELQEFFAATLHLLLINTPVRFRTDQEAREALEEVARNYKLSKYTINFRNNVREAEGIIAYVKETRANMIAMSTHGRKGIAHLFNVSVTERVVNHCDCLIWTYRSGEK